ncbi:hypothetical protein SEVIR_4G288850v4 [Setaria viridis]
MPGFGEQACTPSLSSCSRSLWGAGDSPSPNPSHWGTEGDATRIGRCAIARNSRRHGNDNAAASRTAVDAGRRGVSALRGGGCRLGVAISKQRTKEKRTRLGHPAGEGESGDPEEERKPVPDGQARPASPLPGGKGRTPGATRGYFANTLDRD